MSFKKATLRHTPTDQFNNIISAKRITLFFHIIMLQYHWLIQRSLFLNLKSTRYIWNTAKIGFKHQSINQSINIIEGSPIYVKATPKICNSAASPEIMSVVPATTLQKVHIPNSFNFGFWRKEFVQINVGEYQRGNQKWKIQRNWQHRVHKTEKNKTKTRHNMCWTPLYANKHK